MTLSEEEVLHFMEFDMNENVFWTVAPAILCQGARGMPIGGFLSAQIAEIWACWKEFTSPFGDSVPQVQVYIRLCPTFYHALSPLYFGSFLECGRGCANTPHRYGKHYT